MSAQKRRSTNREQKFEPTHILNIDIGGSGLKAAIMSRDGEMVTDRVRVETPHPTPPQVLLQGLQELVTPMPDYDCVAVGFPGVVRNGKIITAPNLGTDDLKGFDLASELESALGRPVRVINDAEVQGLVAIEGKGVEMVITLGTGFGTALFEEGRLAPHLEIAQHPFGKKKKNYDEALGKKALKKAGKKKWNKRVQQAIKNLRTLVNFDKLYISGGNAKKINFSLDEDVAIISNKLGVMGGLYLWLPREHCVSVLANKDDVVSDRARQRTQTN